MHKQQGWLQAWEYCQAKLIQTLGRASQGVNWSWSQCIKSHHAQTSSGKGLPSHFWNMNIYITFTCMHLADAFMQSELQCIRLYIYCQYVCSLGTEPRTFCAANAMLYHWATGTLNTKHQKNWTVAQWSNVLFSDESKYCISFGNQGPRVWRKSGEWRESMLLEVQCEVSTVSDDLGCHVICWCWYTVFSEVDGQRNRLPGYFRALHASFCWQALWRCWFHFPAGLGTCPHCQRYQKLVQWPWCCCA